MRRVKFFVDKPFELDSTTTNQDNGDVYVNTILPTNCKLKDKNSTVMKFPSAIDVDQPSKVNLLVLPPDKQGNYPLKSRVIISGQKGKRILDQTLEFELSVVTGH